MYFKRFLQLFLIYILAALVLTGIVSTNFLQNKSLTFVLAVLVSYAVLTLPLVLLTVLKTNKKATSVGAQGQGGKVRQVLSGLPGYLILSCQTKDGMQETTIMSFIQSVHEENVFYMVAFTTWFDSLERGERLSSNQVDAEILEGLSAKEVVKHEPNLLKLHENATNMAIIKLKIHSLVHESFRDGAEIIEFK